MRRSLCSLALFLLVAGGLLMLWGRAAGGDRTVTLSWGDRQVTVGPGGITGHAPSSHADPTPVPQDFTEVTAIRAELALADVTLTVGDRFQVSGGEDVTYVVEDGTLTVTSDGTLAQQVDIMVPAGVALNRVEVRAQSGAVELSGLDTAQLRVEAGLGDVSVAGRITGNMVIRTEVGGITVESDLSGYDYTGTVRSELGRVTIDGHDVGIGARLTGDGPNTMDISTQTGDITLRFGQETDG